MEIRSEFQLQAMRLVPPLVYMGARLGATDSQQCLTSEEITRPIINKGKLSWLSWNSGLEGTSGSQNLGVKGLVPR